MTVRAIRILIVTPAKPGSNKGNRVTARRWAKILSSFGHHVAIDQRYTTGNHDLLIALHARKSAGSVSKFRSNSKTGRVVVALTGTDLNCDLGRSDLVVQSLNLADRIVLLEPEGGRRKLSKKHLRKSRVIFQSASPLKKQPPKLTRYFEVSVIGHLRPVKDPFRSAFASRMLPKSSRIRVVHFGQALTTAMERQARKEMERNLRYRWLGSVPHVEAQRRLARSRLTVLSSESEGGSVVIAEAIVNRVPVLASRINASIGMLGSDYPGLFEFKNTGELAELMSRVETDAQFNNRLVAIGEKLRPRFLPEHETRCWKSLLQDLMRK